MSEEFYSIPPEMMSKYMEGLSTEDEEKAILLKINNIEDLWVLAQMKKIMSPKMCPYR